MRQENHANAVLRRVPDAVGSQLPQWDAGARLRRPEPWLQAPPGWSNSPNPSSRKPSPHPAGGGPRARGTKNPNRSRRRREAASPDAAYVRSQAPPARSWSLQPNKHSRPSIPAPARARRAAPARDRRADPARRACPRVAAKRHRLRLPEHRRVRAVRRPRAPGEGRTLIGDHTRRRRVTGRSIALFVAAAVVAVAAAPT